MANYNRAIIAGNLVRDPEYTVLQSGQGVCRLSLASNRQFRSRQTGQMVQEVCFIDIEVWGNQAESCNQYLQKGRPVLVEGRIKLDTWESDGQTRRRHFIVADRVVFLGASQTAEVDSGFQPARTEVVGSQAGPNASSKQKAAPAKKDAESAYKDEPPFGDNLPF